MTNRDRELGMDRAITRRDFLNGVSIAIGGALARPQRLDAFGMPQAIAPEQAADYYPPSRTGMRGAHPGSFEAAHTTRDGRTWENAVDTRETYDLIVVGGGLSGLSAAYFFRKMTSPAAKILILDNHDDFGGHAKRNEFTTGGRVLLASGGTAYMARPSTYPEPSREMLTEIGLELHEPTSRVNTRVFQSLGLRPSVFFDKETFGTDSLVVGGSLRQPAADFLAKTPLSEKVRTDLVRLYGEKRDYLPGLTADEKVRKLQKTSYRDYLLNTVKVHPDVLPLLGGVWCLSLDTASAWFAMYRRSPGFEGLGLATPPDSPEDPAIRREIVVFPAGNSEIARLIVRSLIPESLPPGSMAQVVLERINYGRLDHPGSPIRMRLNSTAVRVRHIGERSPALLTPDTRETEVTYVRGGKAYRARAQGCVLACNNAMIPHLCPEMPAKQKQALHLAVRAVNMTTNVVIRDWKAFAKLGVSSVASPCAFYTGMNLSAPRNFGKYAPSCSPEESILVSLGANGGILAADEMVRTMRGGQPLPVGMPLRDQLRALRSAMLQTPFETFERRIRDLMARALSAGGFDPARDIEAIVVNRWPHGYALPSNTLFDPEVPEDEEPHVIGRKPFGRITVANSDASGIDLTQTAFDEAYRAVAELMPRRFGWFPRI
jgi:spermidine dehydrogenase